jgi:hypothetical protein
MTFQANDETAHNSVGMTTAIYSPPRKLFITIFPSHTISNITQIFISWLKLYKNVCLPPGYFTARSSTKMFLHIPHPITQPFFLSFFICPTSFHLTNLCVQGYSCTWSHICAHPHSVGLPWTNDQLVAEASTCKNTQSQETNIHAPREIRNRNSSKRGTTGLGLRPRGHCDQPYLNQSPVFTNIENILPRLTKQTSFRDS